MVNNQMFRLFLLVLFICTVTVTPGLAQTKITIGLTGGSQLHPPEMIELFRQQNPDIEVEELWIGWSDLAGRIAVMLAAGTAPDVWYKEAGHAYSWRHQGYTADLTPFVERDLDLNDYFFLDAARDARTGEWTAIPSDFQVTALFYNTNHLSSRGISFPDGNWTTDDLVEAARRLTIHTNECPAQYGFNLGQGSITYGWMLWPRLLGAQILSEDRTQSRLNTPETIAALDYMRRLIHEDEITPKPGGCSGYNMTTGGISMEFNIYSRILSLRNAGMDSYDVSTVPRSPAGKQFTTAVPNAWVINAASPPEVQEAAWRWIKFQIGEEAQLRRVADGAGVLVNRNVSPSFLDDPGPPASRHVFLESFAFAGTLEENPVWERFFRAVIAELNPLWRGEVPAETAATNAHEIVTSILEEVYK